MTQDEVVDMKDFNEWWDSDIPITSPFRRGSPAYWAWAGWQAALREHAISEVQRLGQEIEATQRTWVGLDEEDYIKAYELCDFDKDLAFEFFEDKLKEKNK
jgi:hypothetical protein